MKQINILGMLIRMSLYIFIVMAMCQGISYWLTLVLPESMWRITIFVPFALGVVLLGLMVHRECEHVERINQYNKQYRKTNLLES